MKPPPRPVAALSVAVLTLAAVLCTGMSGGVASARSWTGQGEYLALGDSVPFGFSPLLPAGTPASKYVGYPQLAAPVLGLKLTNLSCPGETSGGFTGKGADYKCGDFKAKGGHLHTTYSGTQLEATKAFLASGSHNTKLVTLMIGANDLFRCQETGGCNSQEQIGEALTTYAGHLAEILTAIGAEYKGRLMLVQYYSTKYCSTTKCSDTEAAADQAAQALNGTIAAVGARSGAEIADGYKAFSLIANASRFGGDTCKAGLLIKLPDGTCDVHPSRAGAAVLAGTVVAEVYDRDAAAA